MLLRLIAVSYILVCFLGVTLPAPAQAALITTEESLASGAREDHLHNVQAWLDREDVRGQMQAFGVAPEQAAERVAALSDAELQQLAGTVGEQPAGGGLLGIIGIVFVVLLILELVGVVNVFTRI